MSSSMRTILVIGGTSGIGEAFARRWHSMGKSLILTGRRQDRLKELEKALPGIGTYVMDNTDLAALPDHVKTLSERFPSIDTVWINSGKGSMWSLKDLSSNTDEAVIDEITTNITGPMILARHFIPSLLAQNAPTTFMITGSGLGFVPNGAFPVYPATKAFVHHYMVGLRIAVKDTPLKIIEIVPPIVASDFHAKYSEMAKKIPMMTMDEFTDDVFQVLDNNKAEDLKEIAPGSAGERASVWRGAIGKWMEEKNMSD